MSQVRNDQLVDLLKPDFMTNDARNGQWHVYPDALLLSHFDGPRPYTADFTGNPNGHMGQQATFAGTGVIWRPGKFGKALQVAEAVTNMALNPSGEAAGNWAALGAATVTPNNTLYPLYGADSVTVATTAAANDGFTVTLSALANAIHYVSLYVRGSAWLAANQQWSLNGANWNTPALLASGVSDGVGNSDWNLFGYQFPAAQANGSVLLRVRQTDATARTCYVDAVQVEQRAYRTPYADGSLGSGHTWSGTAHGSTSARTAGVLTYPTAGNAPPGDGTIACWVRDDAYAAVGTATAVRLDAAGATYLILRYSAGNCQCYWGVAGEVLSVAVTRDLSWHHLAATRSGTTVSLYRDGVLLASGAMTTLGALPASMWVGCGSGAGAESMDGLIDDLVILPRALSATEVAALYDCGMPASPGAVSTRDDWQPAVKYQSNSGQTLHQAPTILDYEDLVHDNCGWVVTGHDMWKFTAYTPGIYHVDAHFVYEATATWALGEYAVLLAYVNGAAVAYLHIDVNMNSAGTSMVKAMQGSTDVRLGIGDVLQMYEYQNSGGDLTMMAVGINNQVSIHRVPS